MLRQVHMQIEKNQLTGSVFHMDSSLIVSSSPGMSVFHILQENIKMQKNYPSFNLVVIVFASEKEI